MFRSHRTLVAATAAVAVLLASGCTSVPSQGHGPDGAMLAERERCMMMQGKQDGQPGMPMAGMPMAGKSMDCNCECPMMEKQKVAADAPPASATEHDHAPDAPPPASH